MTRGKVATVDDGDFENLNKFKWYPDSGGYPITKDPIRMHRLILKLEKGQKYVDHINGNKLDNRRENLRICTNRQNMMNSNRHADGASGHKGVSFVKHPAKRNKRWVAQIKFLGKHRTKYYLTKEEAIVGYNEMAKNFFGEFAKLNTICLTK